jgi:hypothetical protein
MKINSKGEYQPFYGWSVICNLNIDYSFIYNFLNDNQLFCEYFTPLISSSYHMTVYNIWCNGQKLITHQEKFIRKHFDDKYEELCDNAKKVGYFNPGNCMDNLLEELQVLINNHKWNNTKITYDRIMYSGNTLVMLFKIDDDFSVNQIRESIIKKLDRNDNMYCYHITLGYQYKEIPESVKTQLSDEVQKLNIILQKQQFILEKPFVCSFENMTKFKPCFKTIKQCIGFLVPDYATQKQLEQHGFDLKAPLRSFRAEMTPLEKNTYFGGAHVSILRRRKYTEECFNILKEIAKKFKSKWSLPHAKFYHGPYQTNIRFECQKLTQAALEAQKLGWDEVVLNQYHIGIYSDSLDTRPNFDQELNI